jgi:chromosome segregation ATPase
MVPTDILGKGLSIMFKKVWIAALAVVVGLVVLGLTGTKAGGLLRMKWRGAQSWAAKQVTPETEIELINEKLESLKKEDRRFVDQIVRYEIKADNLKKQVETKRVAVANLDREVREMFVSLKTEGERVSFRSSEFSRAEMQRQVRQDAEKLQRLEASLKADEAQVAELTETRNLYATRLAELRAERESMRTELQRIQNALLAERLAREKGKIESDDGGLSAVRHDMNELKTRVQVMTKTRELQSSTDDGPVRRAMAEKERQDSTDAFLRARYENPTAPVGGAVSTKR